VKTRTILATMVLAILLMGCDKTSSPDGRAQLRDSELSEKIDALTKKQIIILDSLQVLDKKIEAKKKANKLIK